MKIADPTVASDFTVPNSHRWISDFQSGLINSKKNSKKCKIWSPSTFQYGDCVERFESVVWIFKMAKMNHGAPT